MTRHEVIKALRDAAGSSESLFEKHESDLMYEAADILEKEGGKTDSAYLCGCVIGADKTAKDILALIDDYERAAKETFTGEFQRGNLTALYGLRQEIKKMREGDDDI